MRSCSGRLRTRRALAGLAVAGSFLAACDRVGEALPVGEERSVADKAGSSEAAPPNPPATLEVSDIPDTIYLDLTRFGWYARAEPLRLEGEDFVPGPAPVAASARDMERVGSYEGVAIYRRKDAADSAVYVPVFEGFWLPFVPGRAGGS